ncbi:transcription elongation factor, mitochondrial-like [Branchiostoma floridae]|uniref:Transcription elongation factor, mitochondrial n=1 Tax=Branchiostoma floridae TaxID=7739 RepID=A0A9J7M3Z9_BRAFL|nr:transcription elongation factor, mitochondrial-like [Branchiostoma floridae]
MSCRYFFHPVVWRSFQVTGWCPRVAVPPIRPKLQCRCICKTYSSSSQKQDDTLLHKTEEKTETENHVSDADAHNLEINSTRTDNSKEAANTESNSDIETEYSPQVQSLLIDIQKKTPKTQLDTTYSPEDKETLLSVFNTASVQQLQQMRALKGLTADAIVTHRTLHGHYQTLGSLLAVQGVGRTTLKNVCERILNPASESDTEGGRGQVSSKAIYKPQLSQDSLQRVWSVMSIKAGLKHLSWAHLCRDGTLHDWDIQEVPCFLSGRFQAHEYLEAVSQIISTLPPADLYLLEQQTIKNDPSMAPLKLHFRSVEVLLYSLLNRDFSDTREHRVVSMSYAAVGRYFGVYVSGSRTSGRSMIHDIVKDSRESLNLRVAISQEMASDFLSRKDGILKDALCDCLMQALAFVEIVLDENHTGMKDS